MTQVAPLPPRRSRRGVPSPREEHYGSAEPITSFQVDEREIRGRHATTTGQGFDGVVGWTILGSLVPGLGLVVAGRRTAGRILLGVLGALALGAVALVLLGDPVALGTSVVANPDRLRLVAGGFAVLALLWGVLVVVTHSSLRRYANLTPGQRALSMALVAAMIGVGAVPAVTAAAYTMDTRDTLLTLFKDGEPKLRDDAQRPAQGAVDPWTSVPRVNVLLIGSDDGKGRIGVRPDTLIVASIDTKTGNTVLFSLPRNLQRVPFPEGSPQEKEYPEGFYCFNEEKNANTECLLNAMWQWAEEHKDRYYAGVRNPGLTATVQAAEQILGLRIDNYAKVNLRGFVQFVNAIGGVRVNVDVRLPIGGSTENTRATTGWIEPGRNKLLNGYEAMWYARSRWSTNDFDRMKRQRCVIAAVTRQADPARLALNLPGILRVARDNVKTDIALKDLDAWVTLTMRVKSASVRSLPFTSDVIDTTDPDFDKIHTLVAKSLQPPRAAPRPASPRPSATRTPSTSKPPAGGAQAEDVKSVC